MKKEILNFKNFILNQGFSENTAINYCLDLKEFFNICKIEDGKSITEENIQLWSLTIKQKLTDNKTINRKIASIKKFLNFLKEENDINFNFNKYLKNLKIKEKVLKIPTVEDIFTILKYIKNYRNENTLKLSLDLNNLNLKNLENYNLSEDIKISKTNDAWEDFRNYLIVKMIFTFGFRISEICSLKIIDFLTIENSSWQIIFKKNFVIKGKGSKERILPILDFISEDILKLLDFYPKNILNLDQKDFLNQNLFLNKNSQKITPFYIEKFLRDVKYELGISFDINPHIFRHACGTYLLESGINIREIQVLLGHSSLSTTQRYTKVSKKSLISNLERINI